jgi:uncharacterized phage protein (TIGR02220 family)
MKASHKEKEQLVGRQIIKLQPGEFVTGRQALAQEFNYNVKPKNRVNDTTLWRWLKFLESEGYLNIKSTTKYTVISIKNWNQYQENEQLLNSKNDGISIISDSNMAKNEQQNEREMPFIPSDSGPYEIKNAQQMNNKCTTNAHQVHTNKNDKNDKKEINKDIYIKYIVEIVDYLNEKAGTSYRHTTKKTQRLIRARLKEGFTVEDFKTVIDKKVAEWLHDPKMSQYLRPETLFGTKFESYLNQKVVRKGARYHASSFRSADADHWEYDGLSL